MSLPSSRLESQVRNQHEESCACCLKMEVTCASEMSVGSQRTARRYIREGRNGIYLSRRWESCNRKGKIMLCPEVDVTVFSKAADVVEVARSKT
jgi:hypothetical protein